MIVYLRRFSHCCVLSGREYCTWRRTKDQGREVCRYEAVTEYEYRDAEYEYRDAEYEYEEDREPEK